VGGEARPPRWLWRSALLALALTLTGGLALATAIGAGWNDPRPPTPPDWEVPGPVVLRAVPPDGATVRLLGRPMGRFTLEATASPRSEGDLNGYGLAFRAQGTDRYEVFAVGSDGYLAVLRVEGGVEQPRLDWQPFPHIRRGRAANRLRLACADGTCHFWVNDEYVASLPDDLGPAGEVGLWVRCSGAEDAMVAFAGVAVWQDRRER